MKQKHKKTFSCDGVNHRGYGQYCHRCEEANRLEEFIKTGTATRYILNQETGKKEKTSFKLTDKDKEKLAEKVEHLRS